MPLDTTKIDAICIHLQRISKGEKPRPIDIGELTAAQFAEINAGRLALELPGLDSAVIIYHGRHHHQSRSNDGYTIDDLVAQLQSGLSETSTVLTGQRTTILRNKAGRDDGYGNNVFDEVVLELMAHKPKAEAYSVIPKGDGGGPIKQKPLVKGA